MCRRCWGRCQRAHAGQAAGDHRGRRPAAHAVAGPHRHAQWPHRRARPATGGVRLCVAATRRCAQCVHVNCCPGLPRCGRTLSSGALYSSCTNVMPFEPDDCSCRATIRLWTNATLLGVTSLAYQDCLKAAACGAGSGGVHAADRHQRAAVRCIGGVGSVAEAHQRVAGARVAATADHGSRTPSTCTGTLSTQHRSSPACRCGNTTSIACYGCT